jgi:hypothetical protein
LYILLSDLQLAAEIGKNLLERNKELEYLLKSSHHYLEEQALKNEVCLTVNFFLTRSMSVAGFLMFSETLCGQDDVRGYRNLDKKGYRLTERRNYIAP